MRNLFETILQKILKLLAAATIKKYNPWIVGITGSVGKTSTKNAVYEVLKQGGKTRIAGGNLNNQFGLPLSILGDYDKSAGGAFFWISVIARAVWQLIKRSEYPEMLVLEYGADHPGDIAYLLSVARPNIAVITAVGTVPVHVEFYDDPDQVAREKARLINGLKVSDSAVLNADDPMVSAMRDKTRARVMTFGFSADADVKIINFENRIEGGEIKGVSFKLESHGTMVPVRLDGVVGKAHAYAAAAAACVGLIQGVNMVKISEALLAYRGEKGRTRLIPGIKNTTIIDDTYNASPLAVQSALEILKQMENNRTIAVLGDMAELGKFTTYAHEDIGKRVTAAADVLVTVGMKAKFIADAALKNGMKTSSIASFRTSADACADVQKLLKAGDVVLVKGSQSMRMERVVEEIMAHPENKEKLLVRQYGKWIA